ncbi:hypothetical protein [Thorsellia anophelis]|uniref:Uncharacterized protein n=1 Tax=Thorsellia anophelis DSM 18579 TaxID=1123402 RepID=A0A1I0FRL0_9GAMM|nr:hypothetical protein [Thorsellia anophelis]SET60269.1 hypothetical protein SAMN02583745_02852 [Thorsellia anophelis DSM 18579]
MKLKSKARLKRDAKKADALFKHKSQKQVDRVEKAVQLADLALRDTVRPEARIKSDRPIPNYIINANEINRLGWYQKSVFA